MTADAEKLDRAKIEQILSAIGSRREQQQSQPECQPYDWQQPHSFNEEQLTKLNDFTTQLALEISRRFGELCHADFETEIVSTTQQFAGRIIEEATENIQNHYLAFSKEGEPPWGWLCIPNATAAIWVTYMLGDSESEADPEREFSSLEISLLQDISSEVVQALSTCRKHDQLKCQDKLACGHIPFEPNQTESLLKIDFAVKSPESENQGQASLLMPCDKLEQITGKKQPRPGDYSPEQIKQTITEHLCNTSVTIAAVLGGTALTLEQAMKLRTGDIVLLNNTINEPIDVCVEDRLFFKAAPAKANGKYAIFITDYSVHDDQQ
jgi:flagellar motor switch protein FliM